MKKTIFKTLLIINFHFKEVNLVNVKISFKTDKILRIRNNKIKNQNIVAHQKIFYKSIKIRYIT